MTFTDSVPRSLARSLVYDIRASWLLALLAVACLAGVGQLSANERGLPSAESILDRYVQVTGGKAAYDRISNRVVRSTMAIAKQGIQMSVTIYATKPNKMYTVVESDAIGKIEKGTDGQIVWEKSVMTGPVIKEGAERATVLRDATFDRLVYWRDAYRAAECLGVETVAGKPCYKILLTPKQDDSGNSGKPHTFYYDQKSGRLVKTEMTLEIPMGDIPVEALMSDYREVDGIQLAHKVAVKVLGQERTLITQAVRHNVAMPDDRFELPADVAALLEGQR